MNKEAGVYKNLMICINAYANWEQQTVKTWFKIYVIEYTTRGKYGLEYIIINHV